MADGDEFGLAGAGYFRILAGTACKEKGAVDEVGDGAGKW